MKEWYHNCAVFYWRAQANIEKIVRANKYQQYKMKNFFLSSCNANKLLADTLICENNLTQVKNKYIQLSSGKKTKNAAPFFIEQVEIKKNKEVSSGKKTGCQQMYF